MISHGVILPKNGDYATTADGRQASECFAWTFFQARYSRIISAKFNHVDP
jgi:hypothetical protein